MIDAAAVIGGFDGITRIADAIGIPLEPAKAEQTADFFAALEIGRFRAEEGRAERKEIPIALAECASLFRIGRCARGRPGARSPLNLSAVQH